MDTLTSIKTFHQVVLTGSFTKSAEVLGMSVAMTSKHVSHLERTLGVKLLHRNSRNISLTDAGEQYYRQSLYATELLDNAKEVAQGAREGVQGVLKITMPRWFANPRMAGYLVQFAERYPEVVLNVSLSNQLVDLVADGVDLALRLTHDPKPSLIARPLTLIEFYLVANPDYLAKHGTPTTIDELNGKTHHRIILPTYVKMDNMTAYHRMSGQAHPLTPVGAMYSDDTPMISELVRAGAGIGYAPSWLVEQDLASGRLVRLFGDYELLSITLYAVYVDRAFLNARVRAFIDFMVEKVSI